MIKKLVLLASVVGVGYFLYYGFQQMKIAQAPDADLYSQVPANAFIIVETSDLPSQWENIASNSIIWDELRKFENPQHLEAVLNTIDSSLSTTSGVLKQDFPSLLISITKSELQKNQYVIQFNKSKSIKLSQYLDFLSESFQLKQVRNESKVEFSLEGEKTILYGALKNGIISISTQQEIIKEILHATHSHLLENGNFNQVRATSSKNVQTRVFIQPDQFSQSLSDYTNEHTQLDLHLFPVISSWIELDVDIKPDEISMGGFAIARDSLNHWLSIFKNQEAMPITADKYLPNQTAFFLHFGFSNFHALREKIIARNTETSGIDLNKQVQDWDSIYSISIKNSFLNWIENEIAISVIEPERDDVESESLVWINSSDGSTIMGNLKDIALKVDNTKELEYFQILYKEHEILKLNIDNYLENCFGYQFGLITENYFVQMDDFIVFANSPATLQWCIDRYENGKTLNADPTYENFSQRISERSNIFMYSNLSKSTRIYKHVASTPVQKDIDNNLEFFQNFQSLALQISYESDELYYVNNYLKYSPINKKMPNTIWETPLRTKANFKPVILRNHYTNAKEIFIQDTANTIYLIDSKGNILWSKELLHPILSEITQIDMYKNDKLQIVFNTKSEIYILDRNGKEVGGFPIKLSASTKASVLVADYEKDKNYRLLLPLTDGSIKNFTIRGLETKGWDYVSSGVSSSERIQHLKLKGKDYLVCIFENGGIKALNRRGDVRINFQSRLNFPPFDGYVIEGGESLESTYILTMTKQQDVVKISLDDTKENLFSITSDSITYLQFGNTDSDPHTEIITVANNKIATYTIDGKRLNRFSLRKNLSAAPHVYYFDNTHYFGMVSASLNKIYLSDNTGELQNQFPLKGSSPFTITDINNDGRLNLITVDHEGTLFTYTLK